MRELIQRRWQELSPLLDAALDLDEGERDAWLVQNCTDPTLRAALAQLLVDSAREGLIDGSGDRIARVLIESEGKAGAAAPDGVADWSGRRLGPYRLVRLIGEGGMASVFLAERDDGSFDHQVAVKVLRHGMLDPFEQQRFLRERQILARLHHPHIARLIDGGVTPEGVPWFAMEYVQGQPITSHVQALDCSLEQRLALFLQICEAVAYAHRALVIHRDLKPSNILVAADGSLRLLDFGIARLIEDPGEGSETATVTVAAQRRLTPAYAAPEQWRAEAVTTAADVYALGVLLHELLTGLLPARSEHTSPRTPSSLLRRTGPADRSRAARLRGDLDNIVVTALHPDPQRRYASVDALAEDVRLHLGGYPVKARRDSLLYRSGKWIGRYRWAFVGGLVVFTVLVASAVFSARQASDARLQAARADAVTQFLVGLFRSREPGVSRSALPTTEALLGQGEATARRDLASTPTLAVDLLTVFAGIHRRNGDLERAAELLEQAASVDPTGLPMEVVVGLRHEQALLERENGNAEAAEQQLMALARDLPAGAHRLRRAVNGDLATVKSRLGRHDEAMALHRQVLDDLEASELSTPLDRAAALTDFGSALLRAQRFPEAATVLERALVLRGGQGEVHEDVALTASNLAVALRHLRRYDEAEVLLRRSVAISREVYEGAHPGLAQRLNNLGSLLTYVGRASEARHFLEEALAFHFQLHPDDHPDLAGTRSNLALALMMEGEYPRAVELYEAALAAMRSRLGERHVNVSVVLNNLAFAEMRRGRLDRARELGETGLAIKLERLGGEVETVAHSRLTLARIALATGDWTLAREQASQALAIYQSRPGQANERVLDALVVRAAVLRQAGDRAGAAADLEAAGSFLASVPYVTAAQQVDYWLERGEAALAAGDLDDARQAQARAGQMAPAAGAAARDHLQRFAARLPSAR